MRFGEAPPEATMNDYVLFSKQKTAWLHRCVVYHLVADMRPFAEVEGEGFRKMMSFIQPRYKLATARFYASEAERLYSETKQEVRFGFLFCSINFLTLFPLDLRFR